MTVYIARDLSGELYSFKTKPVLFSNRHRDYFWADKGFPAVNTCVRLPIGSHLDITFHNSPQAIEI